MRRWLIPIVFMTLAQMACVQDCMRTYVVFAGTVVDSEGHPIPEATLTIYGKAGDLVSLSETITVQTDDAGMFRVGISDFECAEFYVDVSATGYEPRTDIGPFPIWILLEDDVVTTQWDRVFTLAAEN